MSLTAERVGDDSGETPDVEFSPGLVGLKWERPDLGLDLAQIAVRAVVEIG